jgi:CubicO group peptidase (beta-lactamase class C family)
VGRGPCPIRKTMNPYLGSESNPIRYNFVKTRRGASGTRWNYNGGGAGLMGTIIARQSGQSLDVFARQVLFGPLGITDFEWQTYQNGKVSAAVGLHLRPRDATKIGQLILNKGVWNGAQIVSTDWIAQSILPRFQANGYLDGLFFCGRFWWLGRPLSGEREVPCISAMGLGGQRIFIVPSLDLVVTSTSGHYSNARQGVAVLELLGIIVSAARE